MLMASNFVWGRLGGYIWEGSYNREKFGRFWVR